MFLFCLKQSFEKINNFKTYFRNELVWNDDDVYVIGGLVDKEIQSKASLGVAKKERIRHAQLPLRRVIGMQCVLNIETMVAVLCDYRLTRDWMYAFRHLSPRIFKARLLGNPFTLREEAVYLAHSKLHPHGGAFCDNFMIGPTAYRQKYIEMLKEATKEGNDQTLQDPEKYRTQTPKHLKGIRGQMYRRNIENFV